MLGRTANGLYWMARYIERGENIARLIDAGLSMALTRSGSSDEDWDGVLQSAGDHDGDAQGIADLEPFQLFQPGLDAAAVNELHRDVAVAVRLADLEAPQDVRMVQLGHEAGLAQEALHEVRLGSQFLGQHLDRGVPVEADLAGLVDRPHATLAEFCE